MSSIAAVIAQGKELAGGHVAWAERVSPLLERSFYDTVIDECVRPFQGLARRYTCDVTDGEAVYCTPPLDTIEAVYLTDSDGEKTQVPVLHSHDGRGGVVYTDPQEGTPTLAIFEGMGSIRLHPTPDFTLADGLELHGYGPYNSADYALTDECPLMAQDEITVSRGIAYLLLEYIGDARQISMERLYRRGLARIEINAHAYTSAHRMRGATPATSSSSGLNPLAW
jgi:hypothetical protein